MISKDILTNLIFKEHKSYIEISKLYNVSLSWISIIAKKYGITCPKTAHPNLNHDYFKDINTKTKAYWLGFLYADGYINKHRCELFLQEKDEEIIDKFCNDIKANINKKEYRTHNSDSINKLNDTNYDKLYNSVGIRISSVKFVNNLIEHGCIISKSKRVLSLPNLLNRPLYLSFLLGFYDGDGSKDGLIFCVNKSFLESIKSYFGVEHDVKKPKRKKGVIYSLHLDALLRKEMFDNFKYSLKRKRCINIGKLFIHKKIWNDHKENIITDLKTMSYKKVSIKYNIESSRLWDLAYKLGIRKPQTVKNFMNSK